MSRKTSDDVVDFIDIIGGDFETWFTRTRLRRGVRHEAHGRRPLSSGASKASTSSTCNACGVDVTPSNSFLRGDRRLFTECYEAE